MTTPHNSHDPKNKDIDSLSGVETTGHEWDGLKELNNPLPRWWLWVFYATCLWAFWYFIVYPAWPIPGGATTGTSGYTQFRELEESQQEIRARQAQYVDRFEKASFQEIMRTPELYAFAMAGGASAFKDNCATCHGSGAEGGKGYPNLNDDDWLWGGTLDDIHTTLLYGIRAPHEETRQSAMPAFGKDGTLKKEEVEAATDFVLAIAKGAATDQMPGHAIFQQQCAMCHGPDGKGNRSLGAPNLTDAIWLYGDKRADIYHTIYYSRNGVMPAWESRLDPQTIRQLAIYVHQRGGGEETVPSDPVPTQEGP